MIFELKVAWRHLVTSHGQTELTVGAVAVGVILVVFLSSLINGLQVGLVEDVVGSIPHITIQAAAPAAKPLSEVPGRGGIDGGVLTQLEGISSQKRRIEQWRGLTQMISKVPGVAAVSATAEGSGFASRGAKKVGAILIGVVPEEQSRVISLKNRIVEGNFLAVDQQNAAIGTKMAEDLKAGIGSRIRIASEEGIMQTFRVACIFDMGIEQANKSWVYVGLPAAQALLKMGSDATTINVRVDRIFQADRVAGRIAPLLPAWQGGKEDSLEVSDWMGSNKAFLDTLKAQNSAALIIQTMTLLASAFGVASVMIVFVVQKAKDIGILKSMGATARQVQKIFFLEGLGVGLGGALIGSGIGTGLCFMVSNVTIPGQTFGGKPATIVPMDWDIIYVLAASAVAVGMGLLSSVVPARRAAKLSPVEAIRRGM